MQKVILTLGLPASGKSTWTSEQIKKQPNKYKRINKDLLREMVDSGIWSRDNEKIIIRTRDLLMLNYLDWGFDVIIDDTNFGKHETHIRQLVNERASVTGDQVEVVIQDFTNVPVEECIKRDEKRISRVGAKVIMDMYDRYLRPQQPKIEYDESLDDIYIVDIDGTVALFGNKNPYERNFEEDVPNTPVVAVINRLNDCVYRRIVFVSGRSSKFRDQTVRWLSKHFPLGDWLLFMRKEGDMRKDSIVKKEIYDENIKGNYNVLGVFDDRKQVKRMWVDNGLFVFDVNQFDREF